MSRLLTNEELDIDLRIVMFSLNKTIGYLQLQSF